MRSIVIFVIAAFAFSSVAQARLDVDHTGRQLLLNCENGTSIIDTVGCGAKTAAETVGNTVSNGVQAAGTALGIIAAAPAPAPSSADSISYAFAALMAVLALLFQ